jgi:hypothetical protein
MRATSVILSVLGVTAFVGATIWLGVEHQARLRLGEQNKVLQQQFDQMASLAAENERLSNLVAQASRVQALPDDQSRELLRLRGEVGVLRQQSKELETLREDTRKVRAARESILKARNAGPAATADRGSASKPSQLEIVKAEYWTDNARLDVTGELRERILGDGLKVRADNGIKGDPEFGQIKHLTIEYRFAGVAMTNEFREGDAVEIP